MRELDILSYCKEQSVLLMLLIQPVYYYTECNTCINYELIIIGTTVTTTTTTNYYELL